jgi:hypothetical protein
MKPNSSPAVTFLTTAHASMPRGVGERLYAATMGDLLLIAIRTGMVFDRDDAAELVKLNHHSSVGVFRALDEHYYSKACEEGGTYPAMWEKHHGIKPWKAARLAEGRRPGRVAPGIAVLLAKDKDAPAKDELASQYGFALWRCTSISDSKIILGRYKGHHYNRRGAPAKRLTLTREAWDKLQAEQPKEKQ